MFMKSRVDKTKFGMITIAGQEHEYDVIIRLDGRVEKRRKKLSKTVYGTSHIIPLDEAKYVYEEGVQWLIIGAGRSGLVKLSAEAAAFLKTRGCQVDIQPTQNAIEVWNKIKGSIIALFHVTCKLPPNLNYSFMLYYM